MNDFLGLDPIILRCFSGKYDPSSQITITPLTWNVSSPSQHEPTSKWTELLYELKKHKLKVENM